MRVSMCIKAALVFFEKTQKALAFICIENKEFSYNRPRTRITLQSVDIPGLWDHKPETGLVLDPI